MRGVIVLLALLLVSTTAFPSMWPEPLPGPIGWETRITPGFDPPIEYFIVYGGRGELSRDELLAKWGPGAVSVLVKLYRDPEWAEWKDKILLIISIFRTAEVMEFLTSEFAEARDQVPVTLKQRICLGYLLGMIRSRDPECADTLLEEGLKAPEGPYWREYAAYLAERIRPGAKTEESNAARARIGQLLQTLPEKNPMRDFLTDAIFGSKEVRRAKEPMDVILKKEQGERP